MNPQRRALKKELADLKRYVKDFWWQESIYRTYGEGSSDTECAGALDRANARISEIEQLLC